MMGDFARTRIVQDAGGIASDMGLQFVRTLSSEDLRKMAGNTLPRDVGRSFRNADLVIEATDGTGARYIAMEVSFTADLRDCNRAIRNAGLITRFTGKPAQPAIASVRKHRKPRNSWSPGMCTGTNWRTGRRFPSEQRRTIRIGNRDPCRRPAPRWNSAPAQAHAALKAERNRRHVENPPTMQPSAHMCRQRIDTPLRLETQPPQVNRNGK